MAAKAVGVSPRYVDCGTTVVENTEPELIAVVEEARVSLQTAAEQSIRL